MYCPAFLLRPRLECGVHFMDVLISFYRIGKINDPLYIVPINTAFVIGYIFIQQRMKIRSFITDNYLRSRKIRKAISWHKSFIHTEMSHNIAILLREFYDFR